MVGTQSTPTDSAGPAPAPRPARTIPALPCVSIDDTLAFWEALGYAVTYRQKAPNPYGVIARDGYELHFFGMKGIDPARAFSTCFVKVSDVEHVHAELEQRLRQTLGRSPAKGLPRISRMRPGQTRFTLTDPNGNSVMFIKHGSEDEKKAQAYKDPDLTPLQRAIKLAERLRDFHVDDHAAAKALDVALGRAAGEADVDRAQALVARAELARVLDDVPLAVQLEAEADALGATRARRPFVLAEAQAILATTPATLDAWLGRLPSDWVHAREGADTWSPFEIVGHLIHGEKTDWLPRVRILLEHGEARAFDRFDRFAQASDSAGRSLDELLDEFRRLRASTLQSLADLELQPPDLDRRGTHPDLGVVTLRQLLATWVAHDLDHLMQIARVIGSQFSDEVGPWRAYLRVISGRQG